MPLPFTRFQYIFPPRPSTSVKPFSETYERVKKAGWIAQMKLNGQRNLLFYDPELKLKLYNRHRELHRNFAAPEWLDAELRATLKPVEGVWTVFDSELLHAKDAKVKNTVYLYDMLVYNGEHLLGTTYDLRHGMLLDHIGAREKPKDDIKIQMSEHIWMAYNIPAEEWDAKWPLTETSWVEGFVLKDPRGRLLPGFNAENNGAWQIRCRKETKVSRF